VKELLWALVTCTNDRSCSLQLPWLQQFYRSSTWTDTMSLVRAPENASSATYGYADARKLAANCSTGLLWSAGH